MGSPFLLYVCSQLRVFTKRDTKRGKNMSQIVNKWNIYEMGHENG